jgi:hypothetical protein
MVNFSSKVVNSILFATYHMKDLHGSFRPRANFNPSNLDLSFSTSNLPQKEVLPYLFSTIS